MSNSLESPTPKESLPPFREPLIPAGLKEQRRELSTFEAPPGSGYIVKRQGIDSVEEDIVRYEYGTTLFKELEAYEGLPVPKFHHVIGMDENGIKTMFTVAEKIEGINFNEWINKTHQHGEEGLSSEEITQVEEHYLALFTYFWDKYESKEDYLSDIAMSSQYVYGTPPDGKTGIYLVDVEPEYEEQGFSEDRSENTHLLLEIIILNGDMREAEVSLTVPFTSVKLFILGKVNEFLGKCPEDDRKYLEMIKSGIRTESL